MSYSALSVIYLYGSFLCVLIWSRILLGEIFREKSIVSKDMILFPAIGMMLARSVMH